MRSLVHRVLSRLRGLRGLRGLRDLRGRRSQASSIESRIAQSGEYWDRWSEGAPEQVPNYWLEIPIVQERVSHRMEAGASRDYMSLFFDFLEQEPERARAQVLSVGCGTGGLERHIVSRFPDWAIHGVDVSRASLEQAREAARKEGLDGISYQETDGVSYLQTRPQGDHLDGIFCHGVLHHMDDLESFFALAREQLRPNGFLFVFEYVGPSRDEWGEADLCWAQRLFERVDEEHRRLPRVWPPLALEDPTEMCRSSEIEPLLERWFTIDRYWPLGGNVVVPLIASLNKGAFEDPRVDQAIRDALDLESLLLERGIVHSHFSVYYCKPRRDAPTDEHTATPELEPESCAALIPSTTDMLDWQ